MPHPRKNDPVKHCAHCGRQLERKTFNGRLEDHGVFLRRKYCGEECASKGQRKANPTPGALRKRSAVFRKNKCQMCETGENLQVHHIDGNPENNEASNLMTLCASCHTTWHWQNGKQQYKRQSACKICGKPARKLDMCQKHYQRFKKYGDPYLTKRRRGLQYELVRIDE